MRRGVVRQAWQRLLLLSVLVAAACRPAAMSESQPEASSREARQALDSRGQPLLRASEVVVHGVTLPVGLHHAYDIAGVPVYRTAEAARRVVDFFASRYGRAPLDPIGDGGVFRAVEITTTRGRHRVDISVLARSGRGARVQVHLLPEPAAGPPVDSQARLQAHWEHLQTLD